MIEVVPAFAADAFQPRASGLVIMLHVAMAHRPITSAYGYGLIEVVVRNSDRPSPAIVIRSRGSPNPDKRQPGVRALHPPAGRT